MSELAHATTVCIGGRGVLISGPSGAGKSDLALRLIDRGARLVSDDQTTLARDGDAVYADAPATIAGRLEVRGVGIVAMPAVGRTRVALAVRLAVPERLPGSAWRDLLGVSVPEVAIDPHEPSAPIKIELALREIAR